MDEESRTLYQRLWHFVWALQAEEWPFKKLTWEEAFTEVANFAPVLGVEFDPEELKDPAKFLPKVAAALYQLLTKPPKQPPSIPLDLQKFVEVHQEYLAKKATLKAKEPLVEFSVDDWIRQLQETVNKKPLTDAQKATKKTVLGEVNETREIFRQHIIRALSQELPPELAPPEEIEPISQKISQGIETLLGDLVIPEEERGTRLITFVNSALKDLPAPEEQKARAQSMVLEQTKEIRENLREEKRVFRQILQTILEESKPTPEEERLLVPPPAIARQQTSQAIKGELTTTYPLLGETPALLEDLTEAIVIPIPEEALTNPARLLEQLRSALPKTLNQAGIIPDERTARSLSVRTILEQLVNSDELTPEQVETYKRFNILPIMGGEAVAEARRKAISIGTSWSEMDYYEVEPGELSKILSVIRHPQTLLAYLKEKATDFSFGPFKEGLFNRIKDLTGIDYNVIELAWKFRLTAKQLQQQIDWLEGKRAILGLIPNLRPIRSGTKEYEQFESLKTWQARLERLEESLPQAGIAGRIFSWRTSFVRAHEKLQTAHYYYQLSTSPLGPRIFAEMVAKRAVRRWIIQPLYEKTLGRTLKWLRLKTGLWEWDERHPGSILTGKRFIRFVGWEKLKKTRVGQWITRKFASLVPGLGVLRKGWRLVIAGLTSLFFLGVHFLTTYGVPSLAGFLTGLGVGFVPSVKLAAAAAGATASIPVVGQALAIPVGVATFLLSEIAFGLAGAGIGIWWARTAWPAITTWFSGIKAQVGVGISGIIPSLTSALPKATLPVLGIAGATVTAGTISIIYLAGSAFHLTTLPTQAGSLYIQAEKTATPSKIENHELAQEPRITYQISFWPTTERLTNIVVTNETLIRRSDGSISAITEDENGKPIGPWTFEELLPGNSYQIQYVVKLDSRYSNLEDSRIVDTATITVDVPDEEKIGEIQTAIAAVTIGKPPMTEPEGWPASGCITQGPNSSGTHQGVQAIDIGGSAGNTIYATHDGTAYGWEIGDPGYPFSHTRYGNFVKIVAPDGSFETYYAHLEDGGVFIDSSGQEIIAGTPIGIVGNTGHSTGPHLHYELRGNPGRGSQINNYLPRAIPPIVLNYCETNNPNFITVISQYE